MIITADSSASVRLSRVDYLQAPFNVALLTFTKFLRGRIQKKNISGRNYNKPLDATDRLIHHIFSV